MEASVILAKCSVHNRTFGIRIEKRNNDWFRTWAFEIDDAKAKREGFDRNTITGSFATDPDYPGCPYCKKHGFVRCNCGKISCYDSANESAHCYWCNTLMNNIVYADKFELSGSDGY